MSLLQRILLLSTLVAVGIATALAVGLSLPPGGGLQGSSPIPSTPVADFEPLTTPTESQRYTNVSEAPTRLRSLESLDQSPLFASYHDLVTRRIEQLERQVQSVKTTTGDIQHAGNPLREQLAAARQPSTISQSARSSSAPSSAESDQEQADESGMGESEADPDDEPRRSVPSLRGPRGKVNRRLSDTESNVAADSASEAASGTEDDAGPVDQGTAIRRQVTELGSPRARSGSTTTAAAAALRQPALSLRPEGAGRLTMLCRDMDIRAVLDGIAKEGNFSVVTSRSINAASPPITVNMSLNDVDVQEALKIVLRTTGLTSRREGAFLYVGTQEDFRDIDTAQDAVRTRIYYPNYVRASELQTLITPLLTRQVGKSSISAAAESGIPVSSENTGSDSNAQGEVLIVRDYESVLWQIDQIVNDVDKRPRQVAIEAMVLSVRLNDSNRRGVDFALLRDQAHVRLISGAPLGALTDISTKEGGLKVGFLDSSLAVFMDALETIGDTNVIASPRLTCLNRQRAEILIGSKLGYVSTTVTETAATQSIQFLDVGTQLRFRPFISSDGTIRLEVHPEVSSGNVRVLNGFTLPDKEVTEVTTNILCYDGSTVIIGGLIREELATTASQIPLLGNLKWAGWLFRRKTETKDRRELIVLISPRIVNDEVMNHEAEQQGDDFLTRQDYYRDKMSPIGKRFYGERFLRFANSAWAAGDEVNAFRYVNLALQFDPMNLNITTLRKQIVEAYPEFDEPVDRRLNEGTAPPRLPRGDYSRQGFPWSPSPSPAEIDAPTSPPNFFDPGRPGNSRQIEPLQGLTP